MKKKYICLLQIEECDSGTESDEENAELQTLEGKQCCSVEFGKRKVDRTATDVQFYSHFFPFQYCTRYFCLIELLHLVVNNS